MITITEYILHFQYKLFSAVQPVCQQGRHILSDTRLSVCPYYTSLGVPASADSETKFVIPEPIDLEDQDTNKIKFIFRYVWCKMFGTVIC